MLRIRPLQIRIAISMSLFFALACNGPFGPFAGGALSGEPGPAVVDDWSFTEGIETLALETGGSDPRSVTVWFATIGSRVYVPTSMISGPKQPSERGWVRGVKDDPEVRIRLDGVVYERVAQEVDDEAEFDAARAVLEAKYGIDPEDRDPERTIWIYRLDARSS